MFRRWALYGIAIDGSAASFSDTFKIAESGFGRFHDVLDLDRNQAEFGCHRREMSHCPIEIAHGLRGQRERPSKIHLGSRLDQRSDYFPEGPRCPKQ